MSEESQDKFTSEQNILASAALNNQQAIHPKKPKTKIVVHINNYVLSKSPSNENIFHTPEDSLDQLTLSRTKHSPKIKKAVPARNDYIILHAKSIKFPVKITPSYEIYPTTNVHDDKYDKYDKYIRDPRHQNYNAYNSHRYDRLLDLNFKLPAISPLQNNQIKPNLTYPNKTSPKMSLPNYLKAQYNLQPPNLLNYKPTNLQPLYNASNRLKELSASAPINIGNYTRMEAKELPPAPPPVLQQPKSESPPQPPKIIIPLGNLHPYSDTELASSHTFAGESFADFNETSILSQFESNDQHQRYSNPNSTFIEQSQQFKLPKISAPIDTNTSANADIGSRVQEETSRLFNLTYKIDDEINKIIRNYPSIVVRRKGVPGGSETITSQKQKRPNNQTNSTNNQSSALQKMASTVLQPNVVISKPIQNRRDLAHTIDYGKLI